MIYRVMYGLKTEERARTAFIVDTRERIDERAHNIAEAYYDNMLERGVIFGDTIEDHVKKVHEELAERNWTGWSEKAIWFKAMVRYGRQREKAIWWEWEPIEGVVEV